MFRRTLFVVPILMAGLPGMADAQEFSGPRIEARVGYDHLKVGPRIRRGGDGLTYGGAIGYDVDLGHVVLGADADVDFSTAKSVGSGTVDLRSTAHPHRELSVGARLGLKLDPKTLVYGGGGYSNGRFRISFSPSGELRFNEDAFNVSGGLERRLSKNAFAKIQYRYVEYDGSLGHRHQAVGGFGIRF